MESSRHTNETHAQTKYTAGKIALAGAEMRKIEEQREERAERIMATDIDKTVEGLVGLFEKKIPKFSEDEGQFNSLFMGVSWRTETSGKRVVELQGDSYIEPGVHDKYKVVLVEGEEPKTYHGLYFYDFEEKATRPIQYNHVTDEFRAKAIVVNECQTWSRLLNDPESTLNKELAKQVVASS